MARHLKDSGYKITAIYDTNKEIAQEISDELSAEHVTNLPAVTALSDVILTVVTDDQAMRDIFGQQGDTLLHNAAGKTFINCATLSPEIHEEVSQMAMAVGAESLEACMASSISQARNGTLYLMIGGNEATFDKHKDLLDTLSTNLRYTGETGSAAKVKALVNMVMNINTAALAEGLGIGDALGLDLNMLCEVFAQTGANSRVLETDAEDMLLRDHECYFSAAHAAKDSGIANALADRLMLNAPLSKATEKQYKKMIDLGLGELDKSGIAELTFKGRTHA